MPECAHRVRSADGRRTARFANAPCRLLRQAENRKTRIASGPATARLGAAGVLRALIAMAWLAAWNATAPARTSGQEDRARAEETAKAITPPSGLTATDHPNDDGTAIDLTWRLSPDDSPDRKPRVVRAYKVFRSLPSGDDREELARVASGVSTYTDRTCAPGTDYLYEVVAAGAKDRQSQPARLERPVHGVLQWFDWSRAWFGVIVLLVCGGVVVFTELVKSGRGTHVREIAGLTAIQEAVGRATEMGRPCLFVPGLRDMNEIATVAGITILSHVARIAADYDAAIEVPTSRSLVMTAAREAVQAAYLSAGRPEAYNEDRVYYVTYEQFPFVAHLTGYMVREKPAACFYAGIFFAESLILAETGNSVGAIQIAGTSEAAQLPFFVAACDYTLIGEELFAASAYLSGEPHQLGSLKGQDAGKVLAGLLLFVGSLVATAAALAPGWPLAAETLSFLTDSLLGRGGPG